MKIFKPEDFNNAAYDLYPKEMNMDGVIAAIANNRLAEIAKTWSIVFGSDKRPLDGWNEKSYKSTTHRARLAFIEEIKPEKYELWPGMKFDCIIAEELMGWTCDNYGDWKYEGKNRWRVVEGGYLLEEFDAGLHPFPPSYSTNTMAACILLIEKFHLGFELLLKQLDRPEATKEEWLARIGSLSAVGKSPAHAICLAVFNERKTNVEKT